MTTIFRFGLGLCLVALLLSCEDQVNFDLGNTSPQLVLISDFAPEQPVIVQVSQSRSPLSTEDTVYIDHAKVTLYQGAQVIEELELIPGTKFRPPYYTTRKFTPLAGVDYTIRAEAPNFKAVSATSSIPAQTGIRSLRLSDLQVFPLANNRLNYQYEVFVLFNDPADGENYYHLNFYQQILTFRNVNGDTVITQENLKKIRFTSELDDNSLTAYFQGGVLFDDKAFNGKPIAYSFPLQVNIDPQREIIGKMYAELRSVSKEYYLFHNSLSRQQTSATGPFTEPVMIYNNIENGQGIFAGYNADIDSVVIQR